MTRAQWVLGVVLWVLTVVGLSASHRQVGYARDEGIYFAASRSYAAYVAEVARSPGVMSDRKARDKAFRVNREHPPLMKTLGGLSARVFGEPTAATASSGPAASGGSLPWMPEGAAMRLPAQFLAGFGVALLFWVACRWTNLLGGLLAAGAFILLPRVWFNAGLHAFDVPVAVASLAVGLVYLRALRDPRWAVALGPLLGVAIVVKHNALFLGPLLALHLWGTLAWQKFARGRDVAPASWVSLPLWSMALGAPLFAWALWPWMWSDTWARLLAYAEFHGQHNWYNMEFLGVNYNQPPMPPLYPAVMTWATVPTVLLLAAAIGLFVTVRRDHGDAGPSTDRGSFKAPVGPGWSRQIGLWLLLLGLFPILLISAPSTPIFGGTKHWLTAYPFLALAAALGWHALWGAAKWSTPPWARAAALVVILGPAAISTADGHPYGLSQYAPLAGGPRGAADLGLNRGFWGHAVLPLVPELEAATGGGPAFVHDVHGAAVEQYLREHRWPPAMTPATIGRARAGLLFHERHMLSEELLLWRKFGTSAPAAIVTLDDVPLTSLYASP